uniref:ATP synthase complex subunit 8 n=1 Tax=Podargus strigoides TaxID=8905 RepID=A0A6M8PVG0_PODST|nr:ATP synthase F0 subunit 8 [Podargus strigoides]QOL12090.1 ATP synthase F0 subunit 8 [Podargus strigoides]USH58310.1 ATP synthase F0 subunit 8 [Podargus strigoides]
MPQLNPNPWFFIMTLSWLTLSLFIQPKLLTLTSTNHPSNKTLPNPKISPWTWPWT